MAFSFGNEHSTPPRATGSSSSPVAAGVTSPVLPPWAAPPKQAGDFDNVAQSPTYLQAQAMVARLPPGWQALFNRSDVMINLSHTLKRVTESALDYRAAHPSEYHGVVPREENIFACLSLIPGPEYVRVVIIGQDPYPKIDPDGEPQATGYAFSGRRCLRDGSPSGVPLSLRPIFNEIKASYPKFVVPETHGDITNWARQGVLLLNTSLTTVPRESNKHAGLWGFIIKLIMNAVYDQTGKKALFVAWGKPAQDCAAEFVGKATILTSAHPSPRNNNNFRITNPFKGCGHFRAINTALSAIPGCQPINWDVDYVPAEPLTPMTSLVPATGANTLNSMPQGSVSISLHHSAPVLSSSAYANNTPYGFTPAQFHYGQNQTQLQLGQYATPVATSTTTYANPLLPRYGSASLYPAQQSDPTSPVIPGQYGQSNSQSQPATMTLTQQATHPSFYPHGVTPSSYNHALITGAPGHIPPITSEWTSGPSGSNQTIVSSNYSVPTLAPVPVPPTGWNSSVVTTGPPPVTGSPGWSTVTSVSANHGWGENSSLSPAQSPTRAPLNTNSPGSGTPWTSLNSPGQNAAWVSLNSNSSGPSNGWGSPVNSAVPPQSTPTTSWGRTQ